MMLPDGTKQFYSSFHDLTQQTVNTRSISGLLNVLDPGITRPTEVFKHTLPFTNAKMHRYLTN